MEMAREVKGVSREKRVKEERKKTIDKQVQKKK